MKPPEEWARLIVADMDPGRRVPWVVEQITRIQAEAHAAGVREGLERALVVAGAQVDACRVIGEHSGAAELIRNRLIEALPVELGRAKAEPAHERCDDCDWTFTCFNGSAPCRKVPLKAEPAPRCPPHDWRQQWNGVLCFRCGVARTHEEG